MFERNAEYFCNFLLFIRFRYVTIGKAGFSFAQLFRKARAAGAAAPATVRACEVREDLFDFFIGIHFAEFRNQQNADDEHRRDRGKDSDHDSYFVPLNGL